MLWVRIPPELFTSRPRGAARSARHPVKVEIRGSNPLGDAFSKHNDAVRNLEKRRGREPRDSMGSIPTSVNQLSSAEPWRA